MRVTDTGVGRGEPVKQPQRFHGGVVMVTFLRHTHHLEQHSSSLLFTSAASRELYFHYIKEQSDKEMG